MLSTICPKGRVQPLWISKKMSPINEYNCTTTSQLMTSINVCYYLELCSAKNLRSSMSNNKILFNRLFREFGTF